MADNKTTSWKGAGCTRMPYVDNTCRLVVLKISRSHYPFGSCIIKNEALVTLSEAGTTASLSYSTSYKMLFGITVFLLKH